MDPTATDILSLLEQLDDEIDDLEDSLAPVLETGISDTASKLPLLDKAKLYVLVTYAVESILFCKVLSPFRLIFTNCSFLSLSPIEWRQGARTPSFPGVNPRQAIFRQAERS